MITDPFGTVVEDKPIDSDPFGVVVKENKSVTTDPFGTIVDEGLNASGIKEVAKAAKPIIKTGLTALENILTQLSRPGYAVTTSLAEMAKGNVNPIELAKAAKKGLFLEEDKKSGYDIAKELAAQQQNLSTKFPGYKPSPILESEIGKRVAGFGIDVATDPLNLFAGPIAKGVKTLGLKAGEKLAPLAKSELGQKVGSIFSKDFALKTKYPEIAKEVSQLENLFKYAQTKSIEEAKRLVSLVPEKTEREFITHALENPELETKLPEISKAGQKVYSWLKKVRETTGKGLVEREMLPEEKLIEYYVRHARTEKPSILTGIRNAISASLPKSLKGRKIEGTIEEINERLGKPFFENDIATLHAISQAESRKAFAAHDYLRKIADNPQITQPLEEIQKAGKIALAHPKEGFKIVNHPLFKDKQVPKEIADHLNAIQKSFARDEGLNAFIKSYDKVLNLWKGQVLISPSYHFRNAVGNFWNNWLGGVKDVSRYADATNLQRAAREGTKGLNKVVLNLNGKTYRGKQVYDLAQKNGIIGRGWYGADIPESVFQEMKTLSWNPTKPEQFRPFHLLKWNKEVGEVVENNARLAHFIEKLAKGNTPEEAAMSVKKYLFDYSDLSDTEKEIFKRVVPFYTWSRKNIPLQLESMILQPGKFATLEKGIRGVKAREEEGKTTPMPEWMRDKFGVPLFRKDNNVYAMVLENWLPAADINKLLKPDELINMVTPLIKTPIEQTANYSFYYKQPLEEVSGQKTPLGKPETKIAGIPLGVDVSTRWTKPWLSQVRVLNEASKLASNYDQWPTYVAFLTGGKLYKYDPEIQELHDLLKKERTINNLIGFLSVVSKRGARAETQTGKDFAERETSRIVKEIEKKVQELSEEVPQSKNVPTKTFVPNEKEKNLNVENGERAKYINNRTRTMTLQESANYLQDLMNKGILTGIVAKQILGLRGVK